MERKGEKAKTEDKEINPNIRGSELRVLSGQSGGSFEKIRLPKCCLCDCDVLYKLTVQETFIYFNQTIV